MKWVPKPYMLECVKFALGHSSAGIFLDPGMSKTAISLTVVELLSSKSAIKAVLVVVPIRPMYKTWPDEIKKWDHLNHLSYTILHGDDKDKRLRDKVTLYLINPEGLKWFFKNDGLTKIGADMLIIDESTKFKDWSSLRFKHLLKPVLPNFKRRLILTGEPAPNGYEDLFPQVYIIDLGKSLGRFITHYRAEYFYQESWDQYNWYLRLGADQEIQEKIKPIVVRYAASDHLEMPELKFNDILVDLPPDARKIYKDFEDKFLAEINGQFVMTPHAAAQSSKCRQVANGGVFDESHIALQIHDAKTQALVDLVEELSGQPVLICYEFQHDIDRIKRAFPDIINLTGLNGPKLDQAINDFNAGKLPYLLGHTMSAGHGLNLQEACHHVCYYGLTWDLDGYHQFYKRIWRQGQKSDYVMVHRILADRTLDKRVARVLKEKATTQAELLEALRSDS